MPDLFDRITALEIAGKFTALEADAWRARYKLIREACNAAEHATTPVPKIRPAHLALVPDAHGARSTAKGGADVGGLFGLLTDEQKRVALAYRGVDTHP